MSRFSITGEKVYGQSRSASTYYNLRHALFYGISLLLSLIIVVVSTTVLVVVISIEGMVKWDFFYLYIGVISANLAVSGISVRQLFMLLPALNAATGEIGPFNMRVAQNKSTGSKIQVGPELSGKYFTEAELEIIELLRNNNHKALQSRLVLSSGTSKASVSRAVSSLERKGVVVKLRKGVTNEILLSETYTK